MRKKRNKKGKGRKPISITLYDSPGSGGETPVRGSSGPRLESGKATDNKASNGKASSTVTESRSGIVSSAVSGSGTEKADALGKKFREAIDGGNFGWLRANWRIWRDRQDLFDYVIKRGADFTVRFVQNAEYAEGRIFAALFDKGDKGMIDGVLGEIGYGDHDLYNLTNYRPELAGSPEKFFRVLGRIKKPKNQEMAVDWGVENLLEAGRYDLVVLLVNALGRRTFKSDRLKDVAIRMAFLEGTKRGNQDLVGLCCELPMITSERYADGLYWSWIYGKPNQVFPLLLRQADQGDLDMAKKKSGYKM